jgi:MFS family permease
MYILRPTLYAELFYSSIDKSNLGNAYTDGFTEDLHFTGNQYNILLSIFYVPFVLSGPGMNLLTKRYGAKYVLPIAMLIFGSMAMLSAACTNFGGIVTTRWFLGMAESGFYAGVIFYLSTFYTRSELAGRLSIYYAASEIAGEKITLRHFRSCTLTDALGAFTGLIAFGTFQINGPIQGWQYLFLIEGSLTFTMGIVALFILPKSSATAYFLTDDEKRLAYYRIAMNSSVEPDAKFSFRHAIQVFKTDRLWPFYALIGIGIGVPLYSVSNFLPLIIARFGYSTVKTNLYTV